MSVHHVFLQMLALLVAAKVCLGVTGGVNKTEGSGVVDRAK